MDMKLPRVFRNNISKDTNYNDIVIRKKINDIFSSNSFIYKVKVVIYTNKGSSEEVLIGKGKDTLLTINNKVIYIKDIIDIKKI